METGVVGNNSAYPVQPEPVRGKYAFSVASQISKLTVLIFKTMKLSSLFPHLRLGSARSFIRERNLTLMQT